MKALLQIVNHPWFWFAVALACGVAAVLFGAMVSVPARVISVLPCAYSLGEHQTVPGSAALVQTADGHHSYTLCREGQPFIIGHETSLDVSLFGGDPFSLVYPAVAFALAVLFVYFGASLLSPRFRWWERGRTQDARHHRHHKGHRTGHRHAL